MLQHFGYARQTPSVEPCPPPRSPSAAEESVTRASRAVPTSPGRLPRVSNPRRGYGKDPDRAAHVRGRALVRRLALHARGTAPVVLEGVPRARRVALLPGCGGEHLSAAL